jgi:intracellular protein transport protein USO1
MNTPSELILDDLSAKLKERDATIALLKDRTKQYVGKLQIDHTAELQKVRSEVDRKESIITELQDNLKRLEMTLQQHAQNFYEKEAENMNLKKQIEDMETNISGDIGNLTNKLTCVTSEHKNLIQNMKMMKLDNESKENLITELRTQVADSKKALDDVAESNSKTQIEAATSSSLIEKELMQIQSSLKSKSTELERTCANLQIVTTSNSALQTRYDQLKKECESLMAQLQAEQQTTHERKKQMKVFVDKLMAEKKVLEETVATYGDSIKASMNDKLEAEQELDTLSHQIKDLQQKIALDEEEFKSEKNRLICQIQKLKTEKDEEIKVLKKSATVDKMLTQSEVEEARRQLQEQNKNAEEHKSKRLAARQEMIQLAQALERSQTEAEEMHQYMQFNLSPAIGEQIIAMENALTSLDGAVTSIHSKRKGKLGHGKGVSQPSPYKEDGSPLSDQKKSRVKSTCNSMNSQGVQMIDRAMDLRTELDRLQIGILLLSQSLERLHEVILLENKSGCCSGFLDMDVTHISGPNPRQGYSALSDIQ